MTLKREIKDAYIEGGASIYVKTHSNAVYVDDNETETLTQRLDNVKNSITEHTSQLNDMENNVEQLSNPNLLINGDFQVWQRGTSFNFTNGIQYSADRWNNNHQTASYSRIINTSQAPCQYAMRVVNNATTNKGFAVLRQPLEDSLINSIKGKEVTLSFYVRGESSVKLNADIGKLINSNYTTFDVELTSEWKRVSKVLCSNECNAVTIQLRGYDGSSKDDWFEVTGVKLELGSISTPFVPKPYSQELADCQRYYCTEDWSSANVPRTLYKVSEDYQDRGLICFPAEMRITPTINLVWGDNVINNSSYVRQKGIDSLTSKSFVPYLNRTSEGTNNKQFTPSVKSYTADAEIY